MIQILTYSSKGDALKGKNVTINKIHDAQSLDEFEINIIDLKDEYIWRNNGSNTHSVNCRNDLISLSKMIENSHKTNIVVLFPTNTRYLYSYTKYDGKYMQSCELKDMLSDVSKQIISLLYLPIASIRLVYENTKTRVSGKDIGASFYFDVSGNIILRSQKSDKPTTIKHDDIIMSTLALENYEDVVGFLNATDLLHEREEEPEWLEGIRMFDDDRQFEIIEESNNIICNANNAIAEAMGNINRNKRYKSILYTNGDELVEVVFEILSEMLGCDLSEFEDKKKEDFLFNIDDHIFIGEIKGVSHNVKNENVSQLDVHYQTYKDENPDIMDSQISALLIINHQKNKPVQEREAIHENQINLASRNGSLIIDTMTLLRLFEKYVKQELTREQCVNMLQSNSGVLTL